MGGHYEHNFPPLNVEEGGGHVGTHVPPNEEGGMGEREFPHT